MDNQHRLVKGYRDLSQQEIAAMNSIKLAEQDIGQLFQQIRKMDGVDQRVLAITKTKLQEAFSWFVRSVAQPLDVYELYIEPSTPHERLKQEIAEVTDRHEKLKAFLETPFFSTLPAESQEDLKLQEQAMVPYLFILNKRNDDWMVE